MNLEKELLQEGFMAFSQSFACPYPAESKESLLWKEGWDIAFNTFFDIERRRQSALHFHKEGCAIAELQRLYGDGEWESEECYGPFTSYESAQAWSALPENTVSHNPYFRYNISYLRNPNAYDG